MHRLISFCNRLNSLEVHISLNLQVQNLTVPGVLYKNYAERKQTYKMAYRRPCGGKSLLIGIAWYIAFRCISFISYISIAHICSYRSIARKNLQGGQKKEEKFRNQCKILLVQELFLIKREIAPESFLPWGHAPMPL